MNRHHETLDRTISDGTRHPSSAPAWVRWAVVVLFAVAMAWMESATVVYLRMLVDRVEPYQPDPLPIAGPLGGTELVREAATLAMLATVGALAGRTGRIRFAYFVIAFGVWDILYYVFLRLIGGWPRSVWDWDILFLLPLPWWGPVIAPAGIAALMVVGGTMVTQSARPLWPSGRAWGLGLAGAALALFVFMEDAIRASGGGIEAIRTVLPRSFDWPLFLPALILMGVPLAEMAGQLRRKPSHAVPGAGSELAG